MTLFEALMNAAAPLVMMYVVSRAFAEDDWRTVVGCWMVLLILYILVFTIERELREALREALFYWSLWTVASIAMGLYTRYEARKKKKGKFDI